MARKVEIEGKRKKQDKMKGVYKRILVDKIREKEERVRVIRERKAMIEKWQQKNRTNMRHQLADTSLMLMNQQPHM